MTNPCFLPATQLSKMLNQGDISASELLTCMHQQIDQQNPRLNAIVTQTPELAIEQAKASDERRARNQALGPLDGLPIAAKDKFHLANVRCTYGSPAFANHIPDSDDLIIARERAAGAVFLGKTNVPEFSFGGLANNPVFGLTLNPYDEKVSTSGSSGGSAVALAAGMTTLANGSDIAGSLRAPAAWCNVVGFRPTPGRIPVTRASDLWEEFSVHGPMARTAADITLYMSAIAGPSSQTPVSMETKYLEFSQPLERDWKNTRIAWSIDLACGNEAGVEITSDMVASLESIKPVFASLGLQLDENCPPVHEATTLLDKYKGLAALSRVSDIIDDKPEQFKNIIHDLVNKARKLSAEDIVSLDKRRSRLWQTYLAFFETCDYLVWPVNPCNPVPVEEDEYGLIWSMLDPQPLLGLPAISIPCGFSAQGHPIGIQITGRRGDDMGVIQLAHAFERETEFWQQHPPEL
jgi:amidase